MVSRPPQPGNAGRGARGGWLGALILAATVMVLCEVALAAQHAAWFATRHPHTAAVLVVAAVVMVGALTVAAFAAFGEVSGWARAAVALVAAQAAIALVALVLWRLALAEEPYFATAFPLAAAAPGPALLGGALVIGGALVTPARSATPRWLVAVAALALAALVCTALWLPCYAAVAEQAGFVIDAEAAVVPVLGPALVAAVLVTVIGLARPRWRQGSVGVVLAAVLVALAAVGNERGDQLRRPWAHLVTQFAPLLLALVWFATLSVIALAVAHVRSARRVARLCRETGAVRGVVVGAVPGTATVAALLDRGWLAGLAPVTAGFTLRTPRGDVAIPAGVDVIAPTPAWAGQPAVTGPMTLLGDGDEVEVVGFEPGAAGDAYRSARAPVLGTRGVAVLAPRRADAPVRRDVLLRLWRPCATLLGACLIAAVPTLASVLL